MRMGQSQLRIEDDRLIRGEGRYTGDVRAEGEAALVVLRSPVAAGRVIGIDVSGAGEMPGVLAILTAKEMLDDGLGRFKPRLSHPAPDGGEMFVPPYWPLATDKVRYLGQPVAAVVAESRAAAQDAAEAVVLDIEEEESVTDVMAAVTPGAPQIWPEVPGNIAFLFQRGDKAQVEAAIAGAAHVVRQRFRVTRVTATAMEPRGSLASYDARSRRYRLELGTQAPHRILDELIYLLDVPRERIQVVAHDTGGSFGMRNAAYPEYVLALWAARRLGRPVRWTADRVESFQSDAHGRDQVADGTLALDADGNFLALDVSVHAGLGAYLGVSTPHPPTGNVGGLAGVYRTPAIHVAVRGVYTNTQITAPYRGAGRPEATYVLERLIDMAAGRLGRDRAELRRQNMIRADEMPFKTGLVYTYDSGDFPAVLDRALEMADWAGFEARRAEAAARGRLKGIGIANPIEIAGGPAGKPNPEFARVTVVDGEVTLYVGSTDSGQGHRVAYKQVVAERLGVDPDRIRIVMGDTDAVPQGFGTFGSRSIGAVGAALSASMDDIVERLKGEAAEALEAAVQDIGFEEGWFHIVGTDRRIAFAEVAERAGGELAAEHYRSAADATFPNGCHICEVEVDPETGRVSVESYVVVDDVGRVVNPLLVKGQIHGGVAQGLAQALMEQAVYDSSGQLVTASFMDYALPRAEEVPAMAVESHPVPTSVNPLGTKGAGEAGTVGALPAAISAVSDALRPLGVEHLDMPATPERVWQAIRDARATAQPAAHQAAE